MSAQAGERNALSSPGKGPGPVRLPNGCQARRHRALLLTGFFLAAGCVGQSSRHRDDFDRLQNWLICDECIDGEREAVRRIGARAVGRLDTALRSPSPQRIALMRAKLGDSFRFAHSPGGDSNAYINPRVANYVATYQKRAAMSLGDIATPEAIAALDRAIRDATLRAYRADVLDVIVSNRARAGAARFAGQITPGQLSFGEVVTVVAPPGRRFTPQDHAVMAGSPFPPDQIPFSRVGDTLRFVAVGDAGPHAIVVTDPGQRLGTAVGSVTITSLLDATDRAMLGCGPADTVCAVGNAPLLLDTIPATSRATTPSCSPRTRGCVVHLPRVTATMVGRSSAPAAIFLSLSRKPPRPDTVDFLKIEPPANFPLTALLDWHGPANLDLGWRRCSPFVPVASGAVTAFASAESTSVVVPAGECWILQVSMGPGGDGPAFARLRIRSP